MCQRVMIAMALACKPMLLIADEPTTGLDVTTQAVVLDLFANCRRSRMAAILITHDLGLAGEYCDRSVVMQGPAAVETAPTVNIFAKPEHPYTRKLMRRRPG